MPTDTCSYMCLWIHACSCMCLQNEDVYSCLHIHMNDWVCNIHASVCVYVVAAVSEKAIKTLAKHLQELLQCTCIILITCVKR